MCALAGVLDRSSAEDAAAGELASTAVAIVGTAMHMLTERSATMLMVLENALTILAHHLDAYLGADLLIATCGAGPELLDTGTSRLDERCRRELRASAKRTQLPSPNLRFEAAAAANAPGVNLVSVLRRCVTLAPTALGIVDEQLAMVQLLATRCLHTLAA